MNLFIDTETTGLDPAKNSIISIGFGSKQFGSYHELKMRPTDDSKIDQMALEVNGYSLQEILSWPDPREAWAEFESILGGHTYTPIYHNAYFDISFIVASLGKERYDKLFSWRYVDTMSIAEYLNASGLKEVTGRSLAYLCGLYNINNERAHSAVSDARATEEVYEAMIEQR